jgi:hypothetical protein
MAEDEVLVDPTLRGVDHRLPRLPFEPLQGARDFMESDRGLRRLTALEHTASTARVLNLLAVHRKYPDDEDLLNKPFFRNRVLNRCIILKHRLRPHEYHSFPAPRPTVTKVLIPIDGTDLRSGAHSFFVGQGSFDAMVEAAFGDDLKPGSRDRQILDLIDNLPSLDPFLLREHLRKHDIEPARGYFSISDADVQRMVEFVREEILALVVLSNGSDHGAQAASARLVDKLLSNAPDSGFEPLKYTLGMSDQKYMEGVFAWRGFLYYKWMFTDLSDQLVEILAEIRAIQGRGPKTADQAAYIAAAKVRVHDKLRMAHANVERMLNIYNTSYRNLTVENNPVSFRDFLLSAPDMFVTIGEQLGAVQHVTSFWRYRMPKGKPKIIGFEELADLFLDFEDGLVTNEAAAA